MSAYLYSGRRQLKMDLLPQTHAKELIRFGSVHWCPVLPHVSESREAAMSEADRERYRAARAAGIAQHGDNVMSDPPLSVFLHPSSL